MSFYTKSYDKLPLSVKGQKLKDYFESFTTPLVDKNLHLVIRDLPVFKKAFRPGTTYSCIVNLIIPTGALVHSEHEYWCECSNSDRRKMRASMAKIHTIVRIIDGKVIQKAESVHNYNFHYTSGKVITPENGFSIADAACAGGIHFFLNLKDAFEY